MDRIGFIYEKLNTIKYKIAHENNLSFLQSIIDNKLEVYISTDFNYGIYGKYINEVISHVSKIIRNNTSIKKSYVYDFISIKLFENKPLDYVLVSLDRNLDLSGLVSPTMTVKCPRLDHIYVNIEKLTLIGDMENNKINELLRLTSLEIHCSDPVSIKSNSLKEIKLVCPDKTSLYCKNVINLKITDSEIIKLEVSDEIESVHFENCIIRDKEKIIHILDSSELKKFHLERSYLNYTTKLIDSIKNVIENNNKLTHFVFDSLSTLSEEYFERIIENLLHMNTDYGRFSSFVYITVGSDDMDIVFQGEIDNFVNKLISELKNGIKLFGIPFILTEETLIELIENKKISGLFFYSFEDDYYYPVLKNLKKISIDVQNRFKLTTREGLSFLEKLLIDNINLKSLVVNCVEIENFRKIDERIYGNTTIETLVIEPLIEFDLNEHLSTEFVLLNKDLNAYKKFLRGKVDHVEFKNDLLRDKNEYFESEIFESGISTELALMIFEHLVEEIKSEQIITNKEIV